MARYYGVIGYEEQTLVRSGVTMTTIVERPYYGDVLRNIARSQNSSDSTIDDLHLSNEISVLADAYAYEHFANAKYVDYLGTKWKISSVEVRRPRLILSMGGVWNGTDDGQASGA